MSGAERFQLRLPLEDFWVRHVRPELALDAEQRHRAEDLIRELRLAFEHRDARIIRVAESLLRVAEGDGSPKARPRRSQHSKASADTDTRLRLEALLRSGRLVVESRRLPSLSARRIALELPLPPLPPAARETTTHSFELRLVDEIGQAVPGIDAEFSADGVHVVPTNAGGVALLADMTTVSASVSLRDGEALAKVLEPRWQQARKGSAPNEANVQTIVFRGAGVGPFSLKAEVPNTVVLQPPLGKLFVELWDKSGRVRHAGRKYSISGPQSFEGVTDEQGRVSHDPVMAGDYRLELTLEPGPDEPKFEPQTLTVPLVTLAPGEAAPQVRLIGAVPNVVLARMLGAFFDTNKTFLLPDGVASLAEVERLFLDNNPSQLLVVGHTDTTSDPKLNDPLSLARASTLIAYFKDDVDTWLKSYDSPPAGQPWGSREDQAMLDAVDELPPELSAEERISSFQKSRSLTVDGKAGPQTRRQLIKEYMALDASTLSDPGFDIPLTAHGCGENFPLSESGDELDPFAADAKEDGLDRRVELYFFDRDLGPQPPPPGKNSPAGGTQYPEWRRRAAETADIVLEPPRRVQLVDEAGVPLAFEPYELVTADGRVLPGDSDADGLVLIPRGVGNEVTLRLTSLVPEVEVAAS